MNEKLQKVDSTKYLGVYIDKKLNWSVHINYINQKLCKSLGVLSKLRHYLKKDCLKQIYFAFFQSHINYALINWGFTYQTHLDDIETSMNKAVRIMSFAKKDASALPLFNNLKLFNFDSNLTYQVGKFLWRVQHNSIPKNISDTFVPSNNGTRQGFSIPTFRTETYRQSVYYLGVMKWNHTIQHFINDTQKVNNLANLKCFVSQLQGFSVE